MKILADEGVDGPIVYRLREDGHEVSYVAEMAPAVSDEVVLDLANQEASILLTADKDFGELVFRQHRLSPGVILIRLAGMLAEEKALIVSSAITEHEAYFPNSFTVITPRTIRIRSL